MISTPALLCLALIGLAVCSDSRHTVSDRRLSEEGKHSLVVPPS